VENPYRLRPIWIPRSNPFLFPGERGHYNTAVSARKEMRVTTTKSLPVNEIGVLAGLARRD
jgi:hypothetical protein